MISIERLYFTDFDYEETVNKINNLMLQLSSRARPILSREPKSASLCNNYHLFAAKNNLDKSKKPSEVVGLALIFFCWRLDGWKGEIHDLVVDEKYRRRGIGDKLMEKLLETALEKARLLNQKIPIYLTSKPSREAANRLYLKHGFKLIAKAHGKNGTNLYELKIAP